MLIDAHVHADLTEQPTGALDHLIACMDRVGVQKAGLMRSGGGGSGKPGAETIVEVAKNSALAVERYPGRFFPLLWLDPRLPFEFTERCVKEYILDGPICGVKLSIQMNARDPRLERPAALMEKNDIPLLFHSWYKTVDKYRFESDPSDIAWLAKRHPGLRVLVAHITGCRFRGVQDIRPFPNLLIDTSGSQPEDGFLAYGLTELGADRVVYGSDYPGRDMATQLGRIESVPMTDDVHRKVCSGNALRFFEGRGSV